MPKYKKHHLINSLPNNAPVVVEASAGTGKTFLIEHRVIDLLLTQDISPSSLVIISHSNATADELRSRIIGAIDQILDGKFELAGPGDPHWELTEGHIVKLQKARIHFDEAFIGTIHAYLLSIIRRFHFSLNLPPAIALATTTALLDEFFRQVLLHSSKATSSIDKYLEHLLNEKGGIDNFLKPINDIFLSDADIYPALPIEDLKKHHAQFSHHLPKNWQDLIKLKKAGSKKTTSRSNLMPIIEIIEGVQWISAFVSTEKHDRTDFLELFGKIESVKEASLKSGIIDGNTPDIDEPKIADVFKSAAAISVNMPSKLGECIRNIVEPMRLRSAQYKWIHGTLSFTDMITLVANTKNDLISSHLAPVINSKITDILLDEFQDTSAVQWKSIRSLFFPSAGEVRDSQRLFVVGDPKQSIYYFSGVSDQSFLSAKEKIKESGGSHLSLDANYRSTPAMVDACNLIFADQKDKTFFGKTITYKDVTSANIHISIQRKGVKSVAPVVIGKFTESENYDADDLRMSQCDWIARNIIRDTGHIPSNGFWINKDEASNPLLFKKDDKSGLRQISYSDIFVLVRTKTDGEQITKHLMACGIPVHYRIKSPALTNTIESQDIAHVLAAIDDCDDLGSVRSAMISPLFSVPLSQVGSLGGTRLESDIQELLGTWRQLASRGMMKEMVSEIMEWSRIIDRTKDLGPDGKSHLNYVHLFEYLNALAQKRSMTIARMIDVLTGEHSKASEDSDESDTQDENERFLIKDDAVQVMTIHASKGKQTPIVHMFGAFVGSNKYSLVPGVVSENRVFMIATNAKDPGYKKIAEDLDREDYRLAYVAMTRAMCRAYIPMVPDTYNRNPRGYMGKFKDWLANIKEELKAPLFETSTIAYDQVEKITQAHFNRVNTNITPKEASAAPKKAAADSSSQPMLVRPTPAIHPMTSPSRAKPIRIISYSGLIRSADESNGGEYSQHEDETSVDQPSAPEDATTSAGQESAADPAQDGLKVFRGKTFGTLVHSAVELVTKDSYHSAPNFDAWLELPAVAQVFSHLGSLYQFDRDGQLAAARMVYAGMTTPIELTPGTQLPNGLCALESTLSESSLLFPLRKSVNDQARVLVTGSVDFTFLHQGKVYFCDWKTDVLTDTDLASPEALQAYFAGSKYPLQAMLYTLAITKALRIKDKATYERLFGGYLYCYVRHIADGCPHATLQGRLTWDELQSFEASLHAKEAA